MEYDDPTQDLHINLKAGMQTIDGDKAEVGTKITLFLNEDVLEFCNEYKAREVIKKYCSFMPTEIYLLKEDTKETQTILASEKLDTDVVVEEIAKEKIETADIIINLYDVTNSSHDDTLDTSKTIYVANKIDKLTKEEFMNELVRNGHEIGNHTRNHYDMTLLANEENCHKFVEEIMITHKTIYEVTNVIPPMIFRFPKGDFSIRSMAMVHDLGFRTYFWSHAYNDYGSDVLKEEAYNNLVTHLHNGAIYLLHPANKGNYEAMEDFVLEAKKQGYSFGLVSEIK